MSYFFYIIIQFLSKQLALTLVIGMFFGFVLHLFAMFHHRNSVVENGNYPVCKNCIFYRPNILDIFNFENFGKCTKYGYKDVVSGGVYYNYADTCRSNEKMCGNTGKDYIAIPSLMSLIMNCSFPSFSEKSKLKRRIYEKIKATSYNRNGYSPKSPNPQRVEEEDNEEEKGEEKKGEEKGKEEYCGSSEEGNCATEFCSECSSSEEKTKKKPTKFVDTDIVSEKPID